MVVCRYFLEGRCRFGDYCKFEHDRGNQQWGFGAQQNFSSPLGLNTNTKTAQPAPSPSVDTNMLVKSVVTDMTSAERGGQWLISCYAPFKEKVEFPGFEDYSFEEDRHNYYEAKTNNLIDQYKQHWQNIVEGAKSKVRALQNPAPEIVNMLKTIYNSPTTSAGTDSTSFATKQDSIFGNVARTSNVFGTSGSSIGAYGQTQQTNQQSIFAATNKSIFGQQQPAQFGSSVFGNVQQPDNQNSQQNVFKNPLQNTGNVFSNIQNQNTVQNQNTTLFTNQNSPNPFGNPQASVFGSQPATGLFGNTLTNVSNQQPQVQQFSQQNQNTFLNPSLNTQNSGNVFASQNSSVFNTQQSTGIFGQIQQNMSNTVAQPIFNQQVEASKPQESTTNNPSFFQVVNQNSNSTPSIFGNSGNTVISNQQSQKYIDPVFDKAYSKLEDLSESDIKWFQSDDLDIDSIPIKPPTYEMCF